MWNPQFSLENPFIGKYSSHVNNVVSCKILNTSPFCLSIDTNNVLRVWDIRTFVTSQVFTIEKDLFSPYIHLLRDDNFLLCSHKLYSVVNEDAEVKRAFLRTVSPIWVEFNEYHKMFVVVTKLDVRLYDCSNGRLEEVFVDLLGAVQKQEMIRTFAVGFKERMFYLGDSAGNVMMYNTKNAEKMKKVTDKEKDDEVVERFSRIMHVNVEASMFKDVSSLIYLEDEKILIVGTVNSLIKLYDEIDSEESELSRVFIGGHKDSEITHFSYCKEYTQLASGSDNGITMVWNLGSGRIDNVYYAVKGRVIYISFCFPLPFLLVVQSSGIVSLWGLKQSGTEMSGKCLLRLMNLVHLDLHFKHQKPISECLENFASSILVYSNSEIYSKKSTDGYFYGEEKMVLACEDGLKEMNPAFDLVKISNDYTSIELSKLTSLSKPKERLRNDQEKKEEISPSREEYYYLLLGTVEGNLYILDIYPFLKAQNLDKCIIR